MCVQSVDATLEKLMVDNLQLRLGVHELKTLRSKMVKAEISQCMTDRFRGTLVR
jgi:hypothetical protein